jgi:hypothetical protein
MDTELAMFASPNGDITVNCVPGFQRFWLRAKDVSSLPESRLAERSIDQLNRFRYWLLGCLCVLSVILHYVLPGSKR